MKEKSISCAKYSTEIPIGGLLLIVFLINFIGVLVTVVITFKEKQQLLQK